MIGVLLLATAMLWVPVVGFAILMATLNIRLGKASDLVWLAIALANLVVPVRTAVQFTRPASPSDRFWILCLLATVAAFFLSFRLPGLSNLFH